MRIMQVMGGDEEGGLEKHVVELTNGLAAAGEAPILVAHAKYSDRLGSGVTFVPCDLTRSRRNPVMLWQLFRIIRRHRPDAVHAQGGKAMAIVGSLKRWLRLPLVGTLHGQKRRQKGLRAFATIITVSRGLAARIEHPDTRVIYNGIRPPSAQPTPGLRELRAQLAPAASGFLWLAVGRLVAVKGFDTLIDAFAGVSGHLLIAGDGPELDTLRRQIDKCGLGTRITLLGHRNDIDALMAACDGIVIASRREGFSYVFAEALMQGRPVVSTDVPIPNEVLPPELICPSDDPAALARLMNALDPGSQRHRDAQAFARQNLTVTAMVSETRRVYRSVAETTGAEPPR